MRIKVIFLLLFTTSLTCYGEYDDQAFKEDLFSPFNYEPSKKILSYGGAGVLLLLATRNETIDPLQENLSENKPLGDLAELGDVSGQLVPNAIYAGYQYFFAGEKGKERSLYMTKASLFAGGTTFFLKRLINQKRPNSYDRNSFPSGHTTVAFAFAGVIHNEHPEYKYPAFALASLVGVSRINDNAHFLHDVVAGASIGLAFAYSLHRKSPISFLPYEDGAMIGSHFKY